MPPPCIVRMHAGTVAASSHGILSPRKCHAVSDPPNVLTTSRPEGGRGGGGSDPAHERTNTITQYDALSLLRGRHLGAPSPQAAITAPMLRCLWQPRAAVSLYCRFFWCWFYFGSAGGLLFGGREGDYRRRKHLQECACIGMRLYRNALNLLHQRESGNQGRRPRCCVVAAG